MCEPDINSTDYYKILGVKRDANDDDIKKAYRKLAIRYHPDKNTHDQVTASKQFKKVSEAYAVLSDCGKRASYDMSCKNTGTKRTACTNSWSEFRSDFKFDMADATRIFATMVGSGFWNNAVGAAAPNNTNTHNKEPLSNVFMFSGPKGSNKQERYECKPKKTASSTFDLHVTLQKLYKGTTKKLSITRKRVGLATIPLYDTKLVVVDIKPWWKDGTKITFECDGDQEYGKDPGDVVFVMKTTKDDVYRRVGNNIECAVKVPLKMALEGEGLLEIDYMDEPQPIKVHYNGGNTCTIPGRGMVISKNEPHKRGNLIINFVIDVCSVSPTKRRKLISVLDS